MADPLATLIRLRRLAVDQARLLLADANREAIAAERERVLALQKLVREARGTPVQAEHALSASFARWLPVARHAIARAEEAERTAMLAVGRSREALAHCQAELKAAGCLAEQEAALHKKNMSRREQKTLDEQAQAARRAQAGQRGC